MRPTTIPWIILTLELFSFYKCAAENSQDVCKRDASDTTASKTPGDNGFRIKVAGRPQPERYTPGKVYTVTINGTYPNQKLLGFMLVAVPGNAEDETTAMGNFQLLSDGTTKFSKDCPHVVTHTYRNPKAGVEVLWTAPPPGTGCIEFRATVIEYKDIWYKDDGALTKVFCEENNADQGQSPETLPECCACGTGKYQMTFEGIWSRQSHPKNYPKKEGLLHWSNIVGASHSKNYHIWQYGDYATEGIRHVCEHGSSRVLEQEMRKHSHDIRTVIKTMGIWWIETRDMRQSRWARFSVDKKNPLFSVLTMIGPSPDWCVGVSALNLCLPNCTWAGDMTINMLPWDAGTDDGIDYMSMNLKSEPQQKIHRITNTFPNNPAAPFFGPRAIKPLGVLKIHRIHPKAGADPVCTGNENIDEPDSSESELPDFNDSELTEMEKKKLMMMTDMERKKLMMMKVGKCGVSKWGDWSECSVTCGVGQRIRQRMYFNPMVNEEMCGQPLMDKESCIGIENECESLDDDCAMTGWSAWSPCSVTCGKGIRERRRYYFNKMDMKRCTRDTAEKEMCVDEIMDCAKALAMKNFTEICSLEKDVGTCRGSFSRWYYDQTTKLCTLFDYGGCRGNNNRFRTQADCIKLCEMHMKKIAREREEEEVAKRKTGKHKEEKKSHKKKESKAGQTSRGKGERSEEDENKIDCMVTPWTAWSSCSATCGKSFKRRQRMIKLEPQNGGKKCPKKLERKKRCKVPKCRESVDCQLGEWTDWSSCLKTCGDSVQERSRSVIRRPKRGGASCGPRLTRRYCNLPRCQESSPQGTPARDILQRRPRS